MEPVIAIVGRPNVGKSTLFNRLTRSRQALVADMPGVTRDRQFGQGMFDEQPYIVIDTPGLVEDPQNDIETGSIKQTEQAIREADAILFVVDVKVGLVAQDETFADLLRKCQKPIFLVANKMDGLSQQEALSDFYQLGFKNCMAIAASQNHGTNELMHEVIASVKDVIREEDAVPVFPDAPNAPKVALIGKPNAGKSTLLNRMLGEERSIVCDLPGTTRDSIYVPMQRMGNSYILIDTAGVRRKKNVDEMVEKFSIIKTLQAIKDAHVVLIVFDARIGLTDQDLTLIDFALEAGRGLIICANKWDGMSSDERNELKVEIKQRLRFVEFASVHFISAMHGTGVGNLFGEIDKVYMSMMQPLSTTRLTDILNKAIAAHTPPMVNGRRIKLRYAHCGGHNPPTVIIHGNQTQELPQSYERYLAKFYMKELQMEGTWVKIICKTGNNPFKDKVNTLTPRQAIKRKRLMKHVKKLKKRTANKKKV